MTVALHDTQLLCDMLSSPLDLTDARLTAKQTHAYYTRRKPWAATINTLANALYKARGAARACRWSVLTSARACRAGVLRHRRVVERGDAAGVLRLPAPRRHLCAGAHLAALWPEPASGHPRRPLLHGGALRGASCCRARPHAGARLRQPCRLVACFFRCPHRALSSWGCACCSAPAPSSCPSSARRAYAPSSSRRWRSRTAPPRARERIRCKELSFTGA